MELIRAGLYELVPVERMSLLSFMELRLAILGELLVDAEEWKRHCIYDAPYSAQSPVIQFFWKYVQSLDDSQRLELLRWMTGLHCMPPGGFSSLHQSFRISKDYGSTNRLPSVSTCSFSLSLPEYDSFELLSTKLGTATAEFSFGRA